MKPAATPLKVTPVAPVKLTPAMVTPVPLEPPAGEKPLIRGIKLAARFQFKTTVPEAAEPVGAPSPVSPTKPSTAI